MDTPPPSSEYLPAPTPAQFSIRHLLFLVFVVSFGLALSTQLGHLGIALTVFIIGSTIGLWVRSPRLVLASLTALAIFVITYAACWVQLGTPEHLWDYSTSMTARSLRDLHEKIQEHQHLHGRLPDSLADLGLPPKRDPWNDVIEYEPHDGFYLLRALGEDDAVGGTGMNADTILDTRQDPLIVHARIPFLEFAYDSPAESPVFTTAFIASLAAGALWFGASKAPVQSWPWLIVSLLATILTSVVVAVFLAAFHVAASQSGH